MTLAQLFDLAFGNIGRFFKEIAFKKEERGKLSYGLVGTLILVLTYGLIMLFSASYSTGYYRFKGDIYHFIRPQVILAVVGLVLMYLISNINYRSLRHMNWYLYILTLLLLVWALFSEPYNGCYRWVYMFGTTLQPSELAKFSAILGLACFADRYYEKRGTLLYGIVLPVLPLLPVLVLLYKEPHNSAIMLILLIAGSMILCGGVGRFWCIPAAGAAVFVIYKMLTGQDNYVQQRLGAWNGDEGDILYQTQQSLYSIASGGLTGLGIGNSRQKHLWLPEASNDFIFSVLCEAGLYRRGDLYGPFCRTDHSGRYHRPELAGLFWYDAGYWHYVANCLADHDPHCGGHQCGPKYRHQPAVFFLRWYQLADSIV